MLQSDDNQTKHMKLNDKDVTIALGIMWNAVITRRAILSSISSIFDQMGKWPSFFNQVLLQDLRIAKVNWDTEVNQKVKTRLQNF